MVSFIPYTQQNSKEPDSSFFLRDLFSAIILAFNVLCLRVHFFGNADWSVSMFFQNAGNLQRNFCCVQMAPIGAMALTIQEQIL